MTEITLEFRKDVPKDVLKELEAHGFVVFVFEPMVKKLHECNLEDLKEFKPNMKYKAIYNGSSDPSVVIGDLLNGVSALSYMHIVFIPR